MRVNTFRSGPASGSGSRRGFPWARVILVVVLIAIVVYFALPRFVATSADGLVAGELVPIEPIFESKIQRTFVHCDDLVYAGQPLAVVSNFLLQAQYSQERQRLLDQAQLADVGEVEGIEQAQTEIADARAKYVAAAVEASKQKLLYESYERTYRDGAIGKVEADAARQSWQEAVATADGYRTLITAGEEHLDRLKVATDTRVSELNGQADQALTVQNSVQAQTLRSPIKGRIVDCAARPDEIVGSDKPLYHIFGTARAYVLAYFSPNDARGLRVGQEARVTMDGFVNPVNGRIVALYPTLAALPPQLTKFFWQHQQWSQFQPVKIAFEGLPQGTRDQLVYNAVSHISVVRRRFGWEPLNAALNLDL